MESSQRVTHHSRCAAVDEKDDDDDDDDEKHKVEKWVLEIEEVHGHDSGVYTCRVHTDLDDVADDLILTVEGQAADLLICLSWSHVYIFSCLRSDEKA